MPPRVIDVLRAGRALAEPWSPVVAGDVNDSQIKLAKFSGAFDWHSHPQEDEGFLVIEGRIALDFEDGSAELGANELLVVPRGVRHRPRAVTPEAVVLMFEPNSTRNTGDAVTARTKTALERV